MSTFEREFSKNPSLLEESGSTTKHQAGEDRRRFKKTLERFANAKQEQCGPGQFEITPLPKGPPVKSSTTEHLRQLFAILSNFCRCTDGEDGGDFKANIALKSMAEIKGADEGIAVEMFILHSHAMTSQEASEWKEACVKVLHDRYVLIVDP